MSDQSSSLGSDLLEHLRGNGLGALPDRMGVELLEATPDRLVARMPVEGNTQPYGFLHGGASVVLAETLGSIGAALHAGPDAMVVGLDINATHHRSAHAGHVTATATAITRGSTIAAYEVVVTDEGGQRVCTSRITCLVRRRRGPATT
ncbi:hotdog fold thioesterase [Segeticoccus rhizosphaerae]|jgi:uncharacterized protein (TIGR00369 family)|uniref:hotdog fold thioesterase n=1 Tax=Segeticoccus rhizosphaerae TaxID=1104777 RepID=UPI0010BF7E8B